MTDTVNHEPAPKSNLIEDLIDIFGSPAAVFARRAKMSPLAPFLTTTLLIVALMFVNQGVMSNIMESQRAKQTAAALKGKNIPPDQLEQIEAQQKSMAKFAIVGIAVAIPITLLCFALVTWLVAKPFGSALTYGSALMVVSFAWIPKVVEQILVSVQGMMLDTSTMTEPTQISLGLARFLDHTTTSAKVLAIAARVDPIILWCTFLLAIGLMAAGKMEKGKAWTVAAIIWVLGVLPALGGAMMAG